MTSLQRESSTCEAWEPSADEESEQTLYDQIGGQQAVAAAVELLYTKILEDESLKGFFENVNMHTLKKHQARNGLFGSRKDTLASSNDQYF